MSVSKQQATRIRHMLSELANENIRPDAWIVWYNPKGRAYAKYMIIHPDGTIGYRRSWKVADGYIQKRMKERTLS